MFDFKHEAALLAALDFRFQSFDERAAKAEVALRRAHAAGAEEERVAGGETPASLWGGAGLPAQQAPHQPPQQRR